jgi:rubredoxin
MVHRYKNERTCPLCGTMTKDFFEMEDSMLVCRECFEEESNNEYEEYSNEEEQD